MNITGIRETGSSDILRFALNNDADIKSDTALQSLINNETSYLVTISDINFLELFRLTQQYRDKLKIVDEQRAQLPPRTELIKSFNGSYADPDNPEETYSYAELVEYASNMFINLALQMSADDDIIKPQSARLFLPMISRGFSVQIPVSFLDIINPVTDETDEIFNKDYPKTLNRIVEADISDIRNKLLILVTKLTTIIRYDRHYDDLIRMTKYFPVRKQNDELYQFGLIDFYKFDNLGRGECRCTMFQPDKEAMATKMKTLARLSTPLNVDIAVRMPLQYMQLIENSTSAEELPISYESSMASIIEAGIRFNDFKTHGYAEDDEEHQPEIDEFNNAISAYQTRINEANQIVLNTIPILMQGDNDVDITSVFAMLPSIYTTKAVMTIRSEDIITKMESHVDDTISTMFKQIHGLVSSLYADINRNR